ncbi:MAG: ABC transporter ATP-binding protein [Acidimicrobiia bacterium]
MNAQPYAIQAIDLVKRFRNVTAVDGISFTVPQGQICALLGPNGAGKSTTIHILLGLTLPTSGTVRVLGHDVVQDRTAATRNTNFTASYVALPARLHVGEILKVYAELYEVPDPATAIDSVIEVLGIEDLRHKHFQRLSSGQQTIVGLAKALINRPRLLFLDEPTASLDPERAYEARQLLLRMAREWSMTIFITSHNMAEIERIADRVLFLSSGKIIADAPPVSLREQFRATDLEDVFLQVARRSRTP